MPVYIRTGKALGRRGTEIGIRFRRVPRLLFNKDGNIAANKIIFKIQPDEGIIIDMASKEPGGEVIITNTNMTFCYRDAFSGEVPEAYQKLLLDALHGDRTLFVSAEENEIAWRKLESILDKGDIETYERGSVPPVCFGEEWIEFERYESLCERPQ
jgi:glucose-6-phosphate 1-dehydrogenase